MRMRVFSGGRPLFSGIRSFFSGCRSLLSGCLPLISGVSRAFVLALIVTVASCTRTDPITVFVGTYSDGFYAYEFDQRTGEFSEPVAKAEMPNPSYLAVHGNMVYAVSELPDTMASVYSWWYGGNGFKLMNIQPTGAPVLMKEGVSTGASVSGGPSSVSGVPSPVAGAPSPVAGAVKPLPYSGADPCYVSTNGKLLAVANYTGGTLAAYRLKADGSIGPMDSLLVSGTGGPDLSRQDFPHVHCAVFTPDGKHLLFTEFSADEIGRLDLYPGGVRNYCRAATLHSDYGPRHLLFDASGKHLFVIGELSGDITVFDYKDGSLKEKQTVKADRMDARGAADIHLSPDGKYLYASLRLRGDGIVVFSVDPDGLLTYVGFQATGPHPRNFNITPNGRWLLVCCRDSDAIEVYSLDPATGLPSDTGRRLSVPRPVFVGW